VVRLLLEGGAKLNKKDHYGNTPLINTCMRGHLDAAQLLLEGGASAHLENQQHRTPLDSALQLGGKVGIELATCTFTQVT
ncbi:hypothetical protein CRUP_005373, partial [Coryphaenoides rupestris]